MPTLPTRYYIYNQENQKLDSDSLSSLLDFCADDYSGAVSDTNPLTVYTDMPRWSFTKSEATFITGGKLIYIYDAQSFDCSVTNTLWYILINHNVDNYNILTSDVTSTDITITSEVMDTITKDAVVKDGVTVGYKYSFTPKDGASFSYFGNTIKFNDGSYMIPLCANIDGTAEGIVFYRTKSSLESFLSAQAYADLKNYMDKTFVWRAGGVDKGNVGKLNITDDTISSTNTDDNLKFSVKNLYAANLPSTKDGSKALVIDSAGKITKTDALPVSSGGTGSTDKATAKRNLGIFYGTQDPSIGAPGAVEGDIYFKILEEN